MTTGLDELVQRLRHPRVLVLGDVLLDRYVFGAVERISPEAPVPVLLVTEQEDRLGGAASVASMLARLEADVVVVGVVGDDEFGRIVRQCLRQVGAAHDRVVTDPSRPTTLKQRYVGRAHDHHSQQILRVDLELRTPLSPPMEEKVLAELEGELAGCDILMVSDYAKGVCTPRILRRAVELSRRFDKRLLIDPKREPDYGCYAGSTCLTPNRHECRLASGGPVENARQALLAAHQLRLRLDLEAVVVTLDREGMVLSHRDGRGLAFPTRERQVYDVTGAGDMVLCMLGLGLASGLDYPEAIALANAAAGLAVERLGSVTLSRSELLNQTVPSLRSVSRKDRPLSELLTELDTRRRLGHHVVFTNGCFDILHAGHVHCLQQARALGDFLVVGINGDESVRRLKGEGRPVHRACERIAVLTALECVDAVTIFDNDTPAQLIEAIRPHVLVKGSGYHLEEVVGREFVEANGGRVVLIPLVDGLSSTRLRPQVG
ncbi:MAG: D-glycero-beta-D-manno-heptose 1-phosphate adenylyltransferase [Isosphaerales bacterium]